MATEGLAGGPPAPADAQKVIIIRLDRRVVYYIVACFVSVVLICGMTLAVAVEASERQTRHFCTLLGTYAQVYRDQPPTTPTGVTLAREVNDLRAGIGCPRI